VTARRSIRRGAVVVAIGAMLGAGIVVGGLTAEAAHGAAGDSTLFAEGGSFAEPMINKLQADTASVIAPLVPGYFNANVDAARDDFATGYSGGTCGAGACPDYVVSEFPLTTDQAAKINGAHGSFAYVPFAASPIAIAEVILCSNDSSLKPGTLCPNLQMNVPQLADVFTSSTVTWTDPIFAQAQGGSPITPIDASKSISPVHGVDPSAQNLGLQVLFENNTVSKPIWEKFLTLNKITSDTPTEKWPTGGGTSGGDQSVADILVPVNESNGVVQQNPTAWGQGAVAPVPVDWLGAPRNIPTFAILNAAGAYVKPTTASMTAALKHATMDANKLVTFGFSTTDAAAYPIPVMSYLIVPTSGLPAAKATALAAFIRFVLGPQGQADIEAFGAAPPTADMVTAGMQVADEVAAESSAPSAQTTSSTTAAPAAATADSSSNTSADGGAATTTNGGPTLAATGATTLPLVVVGASLLLAGAMGRRLWRRPRPGGARR
jgi:ABC-type phosphate transport system substrate-binding protein